MLHLTLVARSERHGRGWSQGICLCWVTDSVSELPACHADYALISAYVTFGDTDIENGEKLEKELGS